MSPEGDERAAGRSGRQEPRPAPGQGTPPPPGTEAEGRGFGHRGVPLGAGSPRSCPGALATHTAATHCEALLSHLAPSSAWVFISRNCFPTEQLWPPPTCQGLLGCWGSALEPGSPSCRPACSLVGEGVTQTSDEKGWSWKCPREDARGARGGPRRPRRVHATGRNTGSRSTRSGVATRPQAGLPFW